MPGVALSLLGFGGEPVQCLIECEGLSGFRAVHSSEFHILLISCVKRYAPELVLNFAGGLFDFLSWPLCAESKEAERPALPSPDHSLSFLLLSERGRLSFVCCLK